MKIRYHVFGKAEDTIYVYDGKTGSREVGDFR